ncbi:MAG: hypothetical protein HUU20_18330, partial [Pirellulales bacterium]|nr:hypothetical protein [Pirellulales bacterium]
MQRFLALHWNQSEANGVVASLRGSRMVVERVFAISLREEAAGAESAEGSVAQRLAAELKSQRLGRLDTVVALGRESVELRHLTLPAAPDEELPDLVRFQALRQFNNLEEQWPLDYVPLNAEGDPSRYVFAAAVRSELVEAVRQTCEAAGMKLARLVLRPSAAASLVARRLGDRAAGTLLIVNLEAEEV